jgi:hypothetical protein
MLVVVFEGRAFDAIGLTGATAMLEWDRKGGELATLPSPKAPAASEMLANGVCSSATDAGLSIRGGLVGRRDVDARLVLDDGRGGENAC